MRPLAAIPVRSFEGMSRLGDRLDARQRSLLTQALILQTAAACDRAGADGAVVTADVAVSTWAAAHNIEVLVDPGRDLDAAARTAVASARGRTWLVVHGDLPLLTHRDVAAVLARCGPIPVLVPSHDGGTSVVAATADSFPFRYGPGSFRRHLAAVAGRAAVLVRPGLALDLDRSSDLDTATLLGGLHDGRS